MRIDIHSHFHSPAFFDHFEKIGGFDEIPSLRYLGVHRRGHWERVFAPGLDVVLERRFADMRDAGCDMQVIGVGGYQPYFSKPETGLSGARFLNDLYLDLAARYPGRFMAWASLPLPHIDEALAEIDRVLGQPGAAGVTLGCSVLGAPMDHERFDPIWEELNRRKVAVYLHPGGAASGYPGSDEFHLSPDFCSPAQLAVCMARLVVRRVIHRYPDIRFIAATTGGGIPFLANRYDHGFRQQNPDEYHAMGGVLAQFRKFWCDTSVIEEPVVLKSAKDVFGADKLLFGTDAPRIKPVEAVRFVERSEYLTEQEKRDILDRNAATLLGLAS